MTLTRQGLLLQVSVIALYRFISQSQPFLSTHSAYNTGRTAAVFQTMTTRRNTFPRSHRLGGRGTFKAIRDTGVRESRGPLTCWAVPNELRHSRLGISIGRVVGTAVRRNRIKRMLREAFRLN